MKYKERIMKYLEEEFEKGIEKANYSGVNVGNTTPTSLKV